MTRRGFIITAVLLLCAGTIFAAWPQLDLAAASFFNIDGSFYGQSTGARVFRRIFFYLPAAVMLFMLLAWIARRFELQRAGANWIGRFAPATRGLVFAGLTLALGPGLTVNVALKDHWGRPRPVHVQEFGGPAEFKKWWQTDGTCKKNCSFVSGEVSGAFWLVAPASLLPLPVRSAALAGAIVVGSITALGRVAFGGHFPSDAIFAALITILICQIVYYLMFVRRRRKHKHGKP